MYYFVECTIEAKQLGKGSITRQWLHTWYITLLPTLLGSHMVATVRTASKLKRSNQIYPMSPTDLIFKNYTAQQNRQF